MVVENLSVIIDEAYEFSAPRFFDFINGETELEKQRAELWFETSLSYAPSPFMQRIKTDRSVQIESVCNFSNSEHLPKDGGSLDSSISSCLTDHATLAPEVENSTRIQSGLVTTQTPKEDDTHQLLEQNGINSILEEITVTKKPREDNKEDVCTQEKESVSTGKASVVVEYGKTKTSEEMDCSVVSVIQGVEAYTPIPQMIVKKGVPLSTNSNKNQMAKKITNLVRNPSGRKPKNQSQILQQTKDVKQTSERSGITVSKSSMAPEFAQENQSIKRQKLEVGSHRQILNVKTQILRHKSRPCLTNGSTNLCPSSNRNGREDRKETSFISTAEMVKRFQSKTRDIELPQINSSLSHEDAAFILRRRQKLTLTRPKEPQLETNHRGRSVRVKSSVELEEEMMANIPKFKARPVNKKILQAPTLPALPRSTPQLPEFQEFHLKTMERANQHAETSTVVSSTESSYQNQWSPHKRTEPRAPHLETSLRAQPPKVKSSQELELEELEKMPKLKAKPLNKKILKSKGDMGIFCNPKKNVTKPQEFYFATDERIPPARTVVNHLDKLSLNLEPPRGHQIPRITTQNPFHLHTEERGVEKERKKFMVDAIQKRMEEERTRIPKAIPYTYTTDYPTVPSKPEPKQCTKPEPFQLESLIRHEEEMRREMEERVRKEKEEAQMRTFKAQPIMKDDPLPVAAKVQKPLTKVEEFVLHVNNRAKDREEFDQKIKEKEMMCKRYREEYESAKMMEEEKALKKLRRTMVPHARPVPNFHSPFHPLKSSKETTKPKSPNLRVVQRKERRIVVVNAATSAAATQMR